MQSTRLTWQTQQVGRFMYPYAFWDNFLSEDELKAIEQFCLTKPLIDSMTIGGAEQANLTDARRSKSVIYEFNPDIFWIFDRMKSITEYVNSECFNFDLLGFDYFQYAEYQGEGSRYEFHTDLIYGNDLPPYMIFPRKLSFTLVLSDNSEYTGGELQFQPDTQNPVTLDQRRGRIVAFPSWVLHRVCPLTSGTRRSIVWWATGPKFR
jgi:PKHD-type hydroxylase